MSGASWRDRAVVRCSGRWQSSVVGTGDVMLTVLIMLLPELSQAHSTRYVGTSAVCAVSKRARVAMARFNRDGHRGALSIAILFVLKQHFRPRTSILCGL